MPITTRRFAVLADLVKQEPGWQDGVGLLMEAYTASGRSADAVAWLKDAAPDNPTLYATLAEFYSREGQWSDAAAAYQEAMSAAPRSFDLRMRYAAALLNQDKPAEVAKARSVLAEALQLRPDDERALLMLSQAERQAGEFGAAEQTARRVIAKNRATRAAMRRWPKASNRGSATMLWSTRLRRCFRNSGAARTAPPRCPVAAASRFCLRPAGTSR
jgi:cytochrome c-type biogenesis protein CcmH/NrfG